MVAGIQYSHSFSRTRRRVAHLYIKKIRWVKETPQPGCFLWEKPGETTPKPTHYITLSKKKLDLLT
jgi:hypothetical protein